MNWHQQDIETIIRERGTTDYACDSVVASGVVIGAASIGPASHILR